MDTARFWSFALGLGCSALVACGGKAESDLATQTSGGKGSLPEACVECAGAAPDEPGPPRVPPSRPAPTCGDGRIERGEECDDANPIDDDECSNDCRSPECGDGIKQSGEECDDANDADGCLTNCRISECGDGIKQSGEECDDANDNNADSCTTNCRISECGDGIKQSGEECDDGNRIDDDECANDCRSDE